MAHTENPPPLWRDPSQPTAERVRDLLGRLSLAEKVALLDDQNSPEGSADLPPFAFNGEALHGLCNTGRATLFPMPIGMAASFDPGLLQRVADATADEMRAKFNDDGWKRCPRVSLMVLSPVINILRDPRWGRAQETYGEDPVLTGALGAAYVRGLQGDHPRRLKVAACAKHLGVHSGPEALRTSFNAEVSRKDMEETYLPAFAELVKADVRMVMATYNRVNGEHCCAHSFMIGEFLRRRLRFDGLIVSDGGALGSLHKRKSGENARLHEFFGGDLSAESGHNLTDTPVETAALCLHQQCDLELGNHAYHLAGEALDQGLLSEAEIDRAVGRHLAMRFDLGVLDPPGTDDPFVGIGTDRIQCPEHLRLAEEAAEKSLVLLKNEAGALPLRPERDRVVFVTGPLATDLQVLLGNFYRGVSGHLVSLLEGIVAAAPDGVAVTHLQGSYLNHPNIFDSDWHLGMAEWSDTIVVCLGFSPLMEGENGECIGSPDGGDKASIALPENQMKLLRDLREKITSGGRANGLVAVITGGCPLELGEVAEIADAVLMAWYPGERGGVAVGRALWGSVNPSGKLPVTFPKRLSDLPPYASYDMRGRTYRYLGSEPLFPFGYGLSYTSFALGEPKADKAILRDGDSLEITVPLRNTGARAGEEVVQVYLRYPEHLPERPRKALKAFHRANVAPGACETIALQLPSSAFHFFHPGREAWLLEPGEYTLEFGLSSEDIHQRITLSVPA
jgi:beta-glucosidase